MADDIPTQPPPPQPDYHDIIFSVNRIYRGSIVHEDEPQRIIDREVVKMDINRVIELEYILREYREGFLPGAGPLTFTLEGNSTR